MPDSEPRMDDGDGAQRRRRRRGGRGGGDRPDRGDRGPRETSGGEQSAPAQAAETRAFAEPQPRRESAPVHEPVSERTEPEAPVHEPVKPATFSSGTLASVPVAFQAVSEHDESEAAEMHRPQRRRRHAESEQSQQAELQLVETQFEAPSVPEAEDDLPHRTKPRRRRAGPTDAEPLKLVETQATAEAQRTDNTPTP